MIKIVSKSIGRPLKKTLYLCLAAYVCLDVTTHLLPFGSVEQFTVEELQYGDAASVSHFLRLLFYNNYVICMWLKSSLKERLSVYLSIRLSVYPSIRLSAYPPIRLSAYPSIRLSVYPSIRLSVYPWSIAIGTS